MSKMKKPGQFYKKGNVQQNENDSVSQHTDVKVRLEQLLLKLGSRKAIADCLNLFNEEIPPQLTKLDFAFQCGNTNEIRSICHGLRSSLVTMEMYQANEMAARMEMLAGQNEPDEIRDLLPLLNKEINEAVIYIKSRL